MCGENHHWHEDFEDEPSVEERFPDEQAPEDFDEDWDEDDDFDDDFREDQFRDDVEADADTLASAGYGTDEDYGGFDDDWSDLGGEG
jgi:hypothetical protein